MPGHLPQTEKKMAALFMVLDMSRAGKNQYLHICELIRKIHRL